MLANPLLAAIAPIGVFFLTPSERTLQEVAVVLHINIQTAINTGLTKSS